jgi:ATP-dependent RNA helicase DeaD
MVNTISFESLNIDNDILKALNNLGYTKPTKVQVEVIPAIRKETDVIVKSQTGSGKTAAFAIPLCEKVIIEERDPIALVLVPTRELAVQVKEEIMNLGRYKRIRCAAVFGKMPIDIQTNELKQRVHFIAGTPGRTLDHIERGNINTEKLKYLVIDEADEMLSMGFVDQIEAIINTLSGDRATMLFSATMPEEIKELCDKYMNDPILIEINPDRLTVEKINQSYYEVDRNKKFISLNRILHVLNPESCIIFCNTKESVDKIGALMKDNDYPCNTLHGGMLQKDRLEVMKSFKRGEYRFLIATDVAARGIHVEDVSHVINFDVPVEKESYIHRIGRTGRAGKGGIAVTLVTEYEAGLWKEIQEYIKLNIPQKYVPSQEEADKNIDKFLSKNEQKTEVKPEKSAQVNKGIMKLHLSAGKDKKIRAGDIVGAITGINGVIGDDIGIIDIQDRFSYVEIMNEKGKLVLEGLKHTNIKGKPVKVERANK